MVKELLEMVKIITESSEIPEKGIVVIDFFATWCGPCKHIAPFFQEMSGKYPTLTFFKVDVDESPDLTNEYDISAMPTFVFLRDRQIVGRIEGADARRIVAQVESLVSTSG